MKQVLSVLVIVGLLFVACDDRISDTPKDTSTDVSCGGESEEESENEADDEYITDDYIDTTLAGSVTLYTSYRIKTAQAFFDNVELKGLKEENAFNLNKVSANKVSMYCKTQWGEDVLKIRIPGFILTGKRWDVQFSDSNQLTEVDFKGVKYTSVNCSISGWIKLAETKTMSDITTKSPATPDYDCEINIECLLNSKKLTLKILDITL